jgi:23S rRNA pseudouridine1911/1915/1917 synthase
MLNHKVQNINVKTRLDNYLTVLLKLNRTHINKLIANSLVQVNNQIISKNGFLLSNNDVITVADEILQVQDKSLTQSNIKLDIVFEDEDLIVINKPKNMLVHPTSFNEDNTVVSALLNKINVSEFADPLRPGIVHRLDKNTTGLMVVAKNLKTYNNLINQIRKRILVRKYLSLVHNNFKDNMLLIKLPIDRNKQNTSKMVISDDPKAKDATTEVKVLENYHKGALIECKLLTGRTHQIRIHLAYIHHPIYNDPMYGTYDGYKDYDQFLHAHDMEFIHPRTKKLVHFHKEPDKTFIKLRETLRGDTNV